MQSIEELCRQIIEECETLHDCITRAEQIKLILEKEFKK